MSLKFTSLLISQKERKISTPSPSTLDRFNWISVSVKTCQDLGVKEGVEPTNVSLIEVIVENLQSRRVDSLELPSYFRDTSLPPLSGTGGPRRVKITPVKRLVPRRHQDHYKRRKDFGIYVSNTTTFWGEIPFTPVPPTSGREGQGWNPIPRKPP